MRHFGMQFTSINGQFVEIFSATKNLDIHLQPPVNIHNVKRKTMWETKPFHFRFFRELFQGSLKDNFGTSPLLKLEFLEVWNKNNLKNSSSLRSPLFRPPKLRTTLRLHHHLHRIRRHPLHPLGQQRLPTQSLTDGGRTISCYDSWMASLRNCRNEPRWKWRMEMM